MKIHPKIKKLGFTAYELGCEIKQSLFGSSSAILERTSRFAKEEAMFFSRSKPVLFVGSGYYPESALALRQDGFTVTLLDKNRFALYCSKKFRFSQTRADAQTFNYHDYDQIIVAVMVNKKELVLRQILLTNPDAIIILRNVNDNTYYTPAKEIPKQLKTMHVITQPETIMHAHVLKKI
ncbi:MAG: hypothetical protein ACMXYF_01695 [Candidatus Woesearchaeota archaeon]